MRLTRKCTWFVTTKFVGTNFEHMLAVNEPGSVVVEALSGSSLWPLMYLIDHGQRDHALAMVLDDRQIAFCNADHLSDC
jgi:hypothetical protein